jgi:hypothetical protein
MIVDPDFLDHWKTLMLADLLGDPQAPLYVIRIWGHCQMRRQWVFDSLPPSALKALCRFDGAADKLDAALTTAGFIRRDQSGTVTVCEWEIYNASLVANWTNGKKGGRPQKSREEKPMGNPSVTHGLPMANPWQTHGEPTPSISSSSSSLSSLSSSSEATKPNAEPFESDTPVPRPPETPGFFRFMNAYPSHRKNARYAAEDLWRAMVLEPKTEAILTGLEVWKASDQWREGKVNRIDNFLKDSMWENLPPESTNGPDHRNQSHRRQTSEDARRAADRASRVGGDARPAVKVY